MKVDKIYIRAITSSYDRFSYHSPQLLEWVHRFSPPGGVLDFIEAHPEAEVLFAKPECSDQVVIG